MGVAQQQAERFPGRCCPGLIEGCPSCKRHPFSRLFPGRCCPGLIEGAGVVEGEAVRPEFPGRCCPGLIEGLVQSLVEELGLPGFRGVVAPASLKAAKQEREAEKVKSFRGVVAPASLKDLELCLAVCTPGSFRGVVAPASLKAPPLDRLDLEVVPFPGRCCPGLIEGSSTRSSSICPLPGFRGVVAPASLKGVAAASWSFPPRAVSGALLPRPH